MKMDSQLRTQWELLEDHADDPSVDELVIFLTKYCNAVSTGQYISARDKPSIKLFGKTIVLHTAKTDHRAPRTKEIIHLPSVQNYTRSPVDCLFGIQGKTPKNRKEVIKKIRRYFLCFCQQHTVSQCKHARLCSECRGRHHTILHFDNTVGKSIIPQNNYKNNHF